MILAWLFRDQIEIVVNRDFIVAADIAIVNQGCLRGQVLAGCQHHGVTKAVRVDDQFLCFMHVVQHRLLIRCAKSVHQNSVQIVRMEFAVFEHADACDSTLGEVVRRLVDQVRTKAVTRKDHAAVSFVNTLGCPDCGFLIVQFNHDSHFLEITLNGDHVAIQRLIDTNGNFGREAIRISRFRKKFLGFGYVVAISDDVVRIERRAFDGILIGNKRLAVVNRLGNRLGVDCVGNRLAYAACAEI